MKPFALVRPDTLARAHELVQAKPEARVFRAGGIDLLDRMKEGLDAPELLVELSRVGDASLGTTDDSSPLVWFGALNTLARIAEHRFDSLAALREAASEAATPSIRNVATLGGNVLQRPRCWYFRNRELVCLKKGGDTCLAISGDNRYHAILGGGPSYIVHPSSLATALMALNALVLHAKEAREGEIDASDDSVIPIEEFFVGPKQDPMREHALPPGHVLVGVLVPARAELRSAYQAVREKQSHDWPLAEAAVRLELVGGVMKDVRVALGHVAPVPWLSKEAMQVLEGQTPSTELFATAAEAALAPAKPLAGNAYKVPLCKGLLREVLHRVTGVPLPD